jgi:hypothetical protein
MRDAATAYAVLALCEDEHAAGGNSAGQNRFETTKDPQHASLVAPRRISPK